MVPVMSTAKWGFALLLVLEVCVVSCAAVSNTESGILQWIQRRPRNDIYYFINDTGYTVCNEDFQNTYLISDNQCVKDQELFCGKKIKLIPRIQNMCTGHESFQGASMLLFQFSPHIHSP